MRRIVVNNNVTLDGVMQAPARPDEDLRGGFEHGGWATPYFDPVMAEEAGKGMAGGGAMLFGRRTYEDFATVWPNMPDDPLVLGSGKRLFEGEGTFEKFELVDTTTTTTGVIIATYRPSR